MDYFYSLQNIVLQCFLCLSTLFPFCICFWWFRKRWTRSKQIHIKNGFISHSIIQRMRMRWQSSHPFAKWKIFQRFSFHLHLLLYFLRFVFILINILLRHIFLSFFFFLILFLLFLHPRPPCLCRLWKWSQLVVIITSISSSKLKFRRWIKMTHYKKIGGFYDRNLT